MIVVSDTSPITNLLKIGRLSLLKDVFHKVIIPGKVVDDLRRVAGFWISQDFYDQIRLIAKE